MHHGVRQSFEINNMLTQEEEIKEEADGEEDDNQNPLDNDEPATRLDLANNTE